MAPSLRPTLGPIALATALVSCLAAPVAAQATAEEQRLARERGNLVLGLGALAALGLLLHERNEDRDERRERRARTLPASCLASWQTRQGPVTAYDPDCLDATFPAAAQLPLACAVTLRTGGRFVSGFSPACLREQGWRTAE